MKKFIAIIAITACAIGAQSLTAQKFAASYSKLETMAPGIDVTPADINAGGPAPAYFSDQTWNGGTTINIAGAPYAAGLSKRAVGLPANVSQCTLTYQIRVSQSAAQFSQANETDLMIVDSIGIFYNGSTRKDNQEGGMWQITNATGAWVDTGFKPGPFPPDVWTQVAVAYQADWTAQTLSVLSIEDGTQVFTPSTAAGIVETMANSGWQKSILDLQIQDTLLIAGSYTRDMRNIGIACQ